MACGIKTLYTVKSFLSQEFCLKLLNALVLSQLQHPAILLNGISQNLITSLEKQLSWAVKYLFLYLVFSLFSIACFYIYI